MVKNPPAASEAFFLLLNLPENAIPQAAFIVWVKSPQSLI